MCLSEDKLSSCAVASCSNWILLAVTWSILVISWTWTIGRLILSHNGPYLDKQSASWYGYCLIYLTVKSYGRVLINNCRSLGMACVRLLSSTFWSGLWSVSSWNLLPNKNGTTSPWPMQLQETQDQFQYIPFNVDGDFCWQSRLGGLLGEGLHWDLSSLYLFARWKASWSHNIWVCVNW